MHVMLMSYVHPDLKKSNCPFQWESIELPYGKSCPLAGHFKLSEILFKYKEALAPTLHEKVLTWTLNSTKKVIFLNLCHFKLSKNKQ